MAQIATKFVQWDVPELATLQGSRVYKLREHLNNGGKLNREDKNWITRNVSESTYFKRGIALSFPMFSSGISSNNTGISKNIMPLTKPHYAQYCMAGLRI